MDSISQFALGSFVGYASIGHKLKYKAFLWGGVIGSLPDLDIFFASFIKDSINQFLWHRGISHSLLLSLIAPLFLFFSITKNLSGKKFPQSQIKKFINLSFSVLSLIFYLIVVLLGEHKFFIPLNTASLCVMFLS